MAEPETEAAGLNGEMLIPTAANSPVKTQTPSSSITMPAQIKREDTLTEFDIIMAELDKKPLNAELWRKAVDIAETEGETDKIEKVYLALLKIYPNSPAAQIAYIDHFLNDPRTFNKAEELFRNYLRNSPSVELCRFYLTYVRRVNADPNLRDPIRMSYEFALNHIGQDKDSGDIWADYIQFLNSDPSASASGSSSSSTPSTWEAQQRMDSLRKVYHRAVQIPLENVQKLWEELETFETSLNKITAKKFLSDLSPSHMQARQVLRELKTYYTQLGLSSPVSLPQGARPPLYLPSIPTFSPAERALLGNWKKYLKWEESNPLVIDDKDRNQFIQRVMGVYRKALGRMRFWAEIWFMAFCFLTSVSKHDEALAILKAGIEANPSSFLLNLKLFEVLEQKAMSDSSVPKDFSAVHNAYEEFISVLRRSLKAAEAEAGEDDTEVFQAMAGIEPLSNSQGTAIGESQGNNGAYDSSQEKEKGPSSSQEKDKEKKVLPPHHHIRREFSLAYIMYMRFARRAEGLKGSRAVFAKARKEGAPIPKKEMEDSKITKRRGSVGWEVYEAAALLEYHTSEDKSVPSRIFEKGMETHGDNISYVERYLGYLISVNDEKNARALFERLIANFTSDVARPLWQRWAKYEYSYGTLEASLKLEKRMEEVYPKDTPIKRFAQRHTYLDIDAIALVDLGTQYLTPHQSVVAQQSLQSQPSITLPQKRPGSPEFGRGKEKDRDLGNKRARAASPSGRDRDNRERDGRERDREHRDRERPFDRERDRASKERDGGKWEGGARRRFSPERKKEDEPPRPVIPQVLKDFIGRLPPPTAFDGPVFRTDDLMSLFRNAVIPSSAPRARTPPPPAPPTRSGGRPPPDYGPYQGPGGGSRTRRY